MNTVLEEPDIVILLHAGPERELVLPGPERELDLPAPERELLSSSRELLVAPGISCGAVTTLWKPSHPGDGVKILSDGDVGSSLTIGR